MKSKIDLGKEGEDLAYKIAKKMGYKVLERNYKSKIGEIDLIALDKDTFVFIEVKTRRHSIAYAKEAIDKRKMRKLSLLASYYLKKNRIFNKKVRFDVIAICMNKEKLEFEVIKNAFSYEG